MNALDVHFGDMRPDFAMDAGTANAVRLSATAQHRPTRAHQMKMPRLCEAHLGARALQSAQTSVGGRRCGVRLVLSPGRVPCAQERTRTHRSLVSV